MVHDLDMWAGCPDRVPDQAAAEEAGTGFGFWVNAMTARDARTVPDPRPALREATAPLLVMRGECDYVAWEVTREYRDVVPNAILVPIDDAGHVISADQPATYQELVRRFLRDEELPMQPYVAAAEPWGR